MVGDLLPPPPWAPREETEDDGETNGDDAEGRGRVRLAREGDEDFLSVKLGAMAGSGWRMVSIPAQVMHPSRQISTRRINPSTR